MLVGSGRFKVESTHVDSSRSRVQSIHVGSGRSRVYEGPYIGWEEGGGAPLTRQPTTPLEFRAGQHFFR